MQNVYEASTAGIMGELYTANQKRVLVFATATIIFAKHAHVKNILRKYAFFSGRRKMNGTFSRTHTLDSSDTMKGETTNKMVEKIRCIVPRDADAEN